MAKEEKGFAFLAPLLIIIVLAILAAAAFFTYQKSLEVLSPQNTIPAQNGQAACTQESKICPDGSSVSRTGANCDFADCPTVQTKETTIQQNLIKPAVKGVLDSQTIQGPLGKLSVIFDNIINENSLNDNNFYVLQSNGQKAQGKIEYNKDTKIATLTFGEAIFTAPGQTQITSITLVVNNIKDLNTNKLNNFLYNIYISPK